MFGVMAARLCGASARLLSWRPDEFWRATPAELAACLSFDDEGATPPTMAEIAGLRAQYPDGDRT